MNSPKGINLKFLGVAFLAGVGVFLLFLRPKESVQIAINGREYFLEVAETPTERAKGLMFRKNLAENEGMLFIFPQGGRYSFWMYNTLIPLDIIWLDKDWNVVHLERNVQPCGSKKAWECKSYSPRDPAKYVIEIKPFSNVLK